MSSTKMEFLLQQETNDKKREILQGKLEKDNSFRYICRTCLANIEHGETFMFINDFAKCKYFENLLISYMIEKSVPEMDLDISDNPIICNTCYNMLWSTYLFKLRCFQTEEKIFMYMEKNKLNLGNKINLQKLLDADVGDTIINYKVTLSTDGDDKIVEDVICISDSESEIDVDGDEKEDKGDDNVAKENFTESAGKSPLDQRRPFHCQQCTYKGSREDLLERHLKRCHEKKVMKNYSCQTCLYSTFRKRNLRKHELVHGEPQAFVCGICERGFTERYILKKHMYKHSGRPLPFKCGEVGCKAAFARKCDLSVHIVTHMSYSPNMCQECNKAFLTKEQLEKHQKKYQH